MLHHFVPCPAHLTFRPFVRSEWHRPRPKRPASGSSMFHPRPQDIHNGPTGPLGDIPANCTCGLGDRDLARQAEGKLLIEIPPTHIQHRRCEIITKAYEYCCKCLLYCNPKVRAFQGSPASMTIAGKREKDQGVKAKAPFKKVSLLSTHRNSGHKSLRVAFGSCEGASFCDFYFVRGPFTSKPMDAALAGLAWTRLVNQPVTRHFGFSSHASFGTSDDNDKEAWWTY